MTEDKICELYHKYGSLVLRVAARHLLQAEQQREVCKQAFVRLGSCGHDDWSEQQLKAWLLVSTDVIAREMADRQKTP